MRAASDVAYWANFGLMHRSKRQSYSLTSSKSVGTPIAPFATVKRPEL